MKEFKICKNPVCRKKFYREDRHTHWHWNRMLYHSRHCQERHARQNKKPQFKQPNRSLGLQRLNDCCNRYTNVARKKMRKEMTVYSSKDMTQEELQNLIPSLRR